MYLLHDGFTVFDNTSNTPTYWKKAKYEMMAKLDNFGPFQAFLHYHVLTKDGKKILEHCYMKRMSKWFMKMTH